MINENQMYGNSTMVDYSPASFYKIDAFPFSK